jgi:thioredoxin reductase/NAD-dependent dihydropyrimidine dehydrogenase PreA subunit
METLIENIVVYGLSFILIIGVLVFYFRHQNKKSKETREKIETAKVEGLYEPVSLHPVVDTNSCIGTGACVAACPEKDILGIMHGKATTINASRCIGHGACFHACPTQAITLVIGTEKRGVELPHVNQSFETNVPGIYIAGELGGMGLIKNAVEQGKQAVENLAKTLKPQNSAKYDLIIVGAGPAGISASLTAKKLGLNFLALEQETLGGTIFTFPRSKIVMTSAMDLPLYGRVKLNETNKAALLNLWMDALRKNKVDIVENSKVEQIIQCSGHFELKTLKGEQYKSQTVLLAIGRRGSPRKLGVPGEMLEKVAYRLLEPEDIQEKEIIVVGGGDSAIESALLLADNNHVRISYRGDVFNRLKPKNNASIIDAVNKGRVEFLFNTNVIEIGKDVVTLASTISGELFTISNDLIYIFAGGELPSQFLAKAGIRISTKFGEAILEHNKPKS